MWRLRQIVHLKLRESLDLNLGGSNHRAVSFPLSHNGRAASRSNTPERKEAEEKVFELGKFF